jgi:hypothetical protein
MIDLEAPIVPRQSAAGISIGGHVSELVANAPTPRTKNPSSAETHDLGSDTRYIVS